MLCKNCKKEFEVEKKRGRIPRFCSAKCRTYFNRHRKGGVEEQSVPIKTPDVPINEEEVSDPPSRILPNEYRIPTLADTDVWAGIMWGERYNWPMGWNAKPLSARLAIFVRLGCSCPAGLAQNLAGGENEQYHDYSLDGANRP